MAWDEEISHSRHLNGTADTAAPELAWCTGSAGRSCIFAAGRGWLAVQKSGGRGSTKLNCCDRSRSFGSVSMRALQERDPAQATRAVRTTATSGGQSSPVQQPLYTTCQPAGAGHRSPSAATGISGHNLTSWTVDRSGKSVLQTWVQCLSTPSTGGVLSQSSDRFPTGCSCQTALQLRGCSLSSTSSSGSTKQLCTVDASVPPIIQSSAARKQFDPGCRITKPDLGFLKSTVLLAMCLLAQTLHTVSSFATPNRRSSSRATMHVFAALFLLLVNASAAVSEFTVKDIWQRNPMAGAPNTITVSLQSTVALAGANSSVVSIRNLTGLSGPSVVQLAPVDAGAGGESLFCSDGVRVGTASLQSDGVDLVVCANQTLQADTRYALSFSFTNPIRDQEQAMAHISASGTASIAASAMTASNRTVAGVVGGAAPLKLVQARFQVRQMGQARPLVSVLNTLTLTLTTPIDLDSSDGWQLNITGLSGTAQPVGRLPVGVTVGGAEQGIFCFEGQERAGSWGHGGRLTLLWCGNSTMHAGSEYRISFNVSNGPVAQASPAISLWASGPVTVPAEAVEKPGTTLVGVAFGADPLTMLVPLLTSANMTQSKPAAGSFNVLTLSFSTNVDLRAEDGSQLTLSGLSGAQADPTVFLQDVAGGGAADGLFCVGAEVAAGRWSSETLTLELCPGLAVQAGVPYALAFTIVNPAAAQSAPSVGLQTSGTADIGPVTVASPAYTVLGIEDGSVPLVVVVPVFRIKAMAQSTVLPGFVNTISVTVQPNVDMLSTDFSRITLSGLPTENTNNRIIDLRLTGGNSTELFSPYPPPSITREAAAWDATNGLLVLFLYRNQVLTAGSTYTFNVDFTNPITARSSPDIYISASGTADFLPALVTKPNQPLLGVVDGANPFLTFLPLLTSKHIQQSTPEFRANNTITVSLQSTVGLYGIDSSAITISGLANAQLGPNISLGGNASKFCVGDVVGQATWDAATESVTLQLCRDARMEAEEIVVASFTVLNPGVPQAAPSVSIEVSGTAGISAQAMDTPGTATAVLEVPGGADPMKVVIVLYWDSFGVTEGPSKGGTVVPVFGTHLSEGGGDFACLFENDDLPSGVEVPAVLISDTQLNCTTPAWPVRGGVVRLRLKYEGVRLPFRAVAAIDDNATVWVHTEPAPAQFLLYDGWEGVAAGSTTRGAAAGGDVIFVDGYGFDWMRVYRCTFSRGAQSMDTVAIVRSLSQLSCESPSWGLEYPAGTDDVEGQVSVSVVKDGSALPFTDHGLVPVSPDVCAEMSHPGRCAFVFYPIWSADGNTQNVRIDPSTPTVFTAAGGQALNISGLGFSANLSYLCVFEYQVGFLHSYSATSPAPAAVVSSVLVQCPTPVWEFASVSSASVTLLVNTTTNATATAYEVPLADAEVPLLVAFEEFYISLSNTSGLAIGGETITIRGLGFDPAKLYAVDFVAGHRHVEASFLSLTELVVQTPLIPGMARDISILLKYNGSEPLRLVPGWPSNLTTASSLVFTVLPVWTGITPVEVSRTAGATLPVVQVQGLGFQPPPTIYTCTFSNANGSETTVGEASPAAISCPINVSGFQEDWDVAVFGTLDLYSDNVLVASTLQFASVELIHVNAQPSFVGSPRWIFWMAGAAPYSEPWAQNISTGADLEAGQSHTFIVSYSPTELLQGAPSIDVNGVLQFAPSPGRSGLVTLVVAMQDSGGTRFGGVDTSVVQTAYIHIEAEETYPNFLANRTTVTVYEDSEQVSFPRFMTVDEENVVTLSEFITIDDEGDSRILETFTIEITPNSILDNEYFDVIPMITEDGALVFRAKDHAFGIASYNMTVTFEDSAAGRSFAVTETVTINILSVNDPPSFSLDVNSRSFTELELLESDEHVIGKLASAVYAGQPLALTGPAGEDWGELTQNLSFVVEIVGDAAFLRSTPRIDIFTDGANTTYTAIGNLTFGSIPHANGVALLSVVLEDAGGLNTTQQLVEIVVLPVNDEPAFKLDCNLSDAVDCTRNCSEFGLEGCAVEVRVDENCDGCQEDVSTGCSAGFSLQGLFVVDASRYLSPDEQGQNLSFTVDMVDGDPLFVRSGQPYVVLEEGGTLTFCLEEDANGNATFNVSLHDDGGMALGGINTSKMATLALFVHPVNQAPSFEVNESVQYLFFWMNSGNNSVENFAVDILRGRRDINGSDRELFQDISFLVHPNNASLFTRTPQVAPDGTLSFSLSQDRAGLVNLTVRVVDDGGTYGEGKNTSQPRFGMLAVVDAYVLLEVGVFDSCMGPGWTSRLGADVAALLGVNAKWVEVLEQSPPSAPDPPYSNNHSNHTNHSSSPHSSMDTADAWTYPEYVSFFDPDGTDPALVLRNRSSAVTIRVVGVSKSAVVGYLMAWHAAGPNLHNALTSVCAGWPWIYSRTSNAFLISNLNNEPAFQEGSANVAWMEEETATSRVYEGFVYGIVAPRDVPIDRNGSEQVIFDVSPIGHKLFRRTSWTMDGTDGGLVTVQPTLTAVCTPLCQNATLAFQHRALWNGQVMYQARMRSTNVTKNFTLTVSPVNQKPSFGLHSPVVLLEAPSFRTEAVQYNRSGFVIVERHGNVTIDGFAFAVSAGPAVEDEQNQNLSFAIELLGRAGSVQITAAPLLEIVNNTAQLSFAIQQHTSGVLNFSATLSDSGVPASENFTSLFTVVVQSVNDEPAFTINCSSSDAANCTQQCSVPGSEDCSVEIRMDENCDFCPQDLNTGCVAGFSVSGLFLSDASKYESADEQGQNLTFALDMVSGDDLFVHGNMPRVLVREDGTISFCLREDENGEATFNVTLYDDGGVARGGIDMSAVASVRIVVHPVNQQPSFNVSYDSYLWFWMNSGNNSVNDFAIDILRGNADADGTDREFFQNVTFIETAEDHPIFASVPSVNSTGTLFFEVQDEAVGIANFTLTLVDDGGTYGTGQNTSETKLVTVSVVESYLTLYLTWDDTSPQWSGVEGQTRLAHVIARTLEIHPNWVIFVNPPQDGLRQLLQTEQVLTVRVLALTSEQALDYAARVRDLALETDAAFGEPGLSRVAVEAFRRNFGADPRFDINSSAWTWLEQENDASFVVPGFAVEMFAPQDVPIDAQGRERVYLEVRPVGHRLFLRDSWTFDGTDGGLITQQPTLTTVCAPLCKNATLRFGHAALYNGQAMYEASMLTTNFSLNFTITILPVDQQPSFSMQPVLFVLAEVANASVSNWVTGIETGPMIEDEQLQLVVFRVDPLTRAGINASITPENATAAARSAVLGLRLLEPTEGTYEFNVTMQDDGTDSNGGVDTARIKSFRVESVRVNSSVAVLENECVEHACHFPLFASDIAALEYNGAEINYDISVIQGDVVVGAQLHQNGTLAFKTLPMRIGNVTLKVVLTSNGPIRWSLLYREVVVDVLFVNQPPSFALASTRVTGEQDAALSTLLVTNISRGPNAVPPEVIQELTFTVSRLDLDSQSLEAACAVSFCLALATAPLFAQMPVVSPNGTLALDVQRYGFGAAQYNISLTDDGGTERGGSNQSSTKQFCVVVEPTERLIPFAINNDHIYASEADGMDDMHTVPNFVEILDESIRHKGVHFDVSAIAELVPNLPTDQFSPATGDLFLAGTDTQLFANGTMLSLDLNGTLSFQLAEQRNGKVRFSITLKDDRGMSCSESLTFVLEILPVNQPPTFELQSLLALSEPDTDTAVAALVVTQLSRGGWAEESQRLFLTFEIVDGSTSLLQDLEFTFVSAANATLDFTIPANRYGEVTLNVTLRDSGGFERGGHDTVQGVMTIIVSAINDAPSFRLTTTNIVINRNTGSACAARLTGVPWVAWSGPDSLCSPEWAGLRAADQVASSARCTPYLEGRLNEHVGIVTDISLGPFEEITYAGCDTLCPHASGVPECGCEMQTGNFTIEPVDVVGAQRLFEVLPRLILPCAVLTFSPALNEIGSQKFRIALSDSDVLEPNGNLTTPWQYFNITIVGINIRPHFDFVEPGITVREDAGQVAQQIATNISADGQGGVYEPGQSVTFIVVVLSNSDDLFAVGGNPSMTSDGTISFTTRQDAFGNATLLVRVQDDGGTERAGVNVFEQTLVILVLGVNNAPSFDFQDTVFVLQSSGFNSIPLFATNVVAGPANEASQQVTFFVETVSNQNLFLTLPAIDVDGDTGTLRLTLVEGQSGVAHIAFHVQDNNGTELDGVDTSVTATFSVVVEPVNSPPSFGLPWTVSCVTARIWDEGTCTCPVWEPALLAEPDIPPVGVCSLHVEGSTKASSAVGETVVEVLEDVGEVFIEGFAVHVTPEQGKLSASWAHFEMDYHLDELTFTGLLQDDVLGAEGMEYAYATAPSSDFGRLLYVAERETSTLGVFCYNRTYQAACAAQARVEVDGNLLPGNETVIQYARIAQGLSRFSYDTPDPLLSLGGIVCDLHQFELSGFRYVAAATGCWPVTGNQTVGPVSLLPSKIYRVDTILPGMTHALVEETGFFPTDAATTEQLSGASSFHFFSRDSAHFLAVAKSISSSGSRDVSSAIYRLDAAAPAVLVDSVAGAGSREWVRVQVGGVDYMALANFNGPSFLYPMGGGGTVREDLRVQIYPARATGIKAVYAGGEAFLVISAHGSERVDTFANATNMTSNETYTVTVPGPEYPCTVLWLRAQGGVVSPASLQNLTITQAVGVETWRSRDSIFVAFAVNSNASSLVFSSPARRQPRFELVQQLPALVHGIEHYTIDGIDHLALSKDLSTELYRWDGLLFRLKPSPNSRPQDLAGGVVVELGSVAAVHIGGISNTTITGIPNDRESPGSIVLGTDMGLILVQGTYEPPITGLNGPTAVVAVPVAPSNGADLVVVASKYSAGLTTFIVDTSGELVQKEVVDCQAQGHTTNDPWTNFAVSGDGAYIFAVSHDASAVAAFGVTYSTAQLQCLFFVQDGDIQLGAIVDGLKGAQAVVASEDDQRVYVASWRDAAVVAFLWDPFRLVCASGLCFVDRLKGGERDTSSFRADVNETVGVRLPYGGEFPARMGGNSQPWSFSTVDSEAWEYDGVPYLAVCTGSSVAVSVWNTTDASYEIVQEITHDPSPSSIRAFVIRDREDVSWQYLAVGTSLDASASASSPPISIRVFRWNPVSRRFVLHHTVLLKLRDGSAFEAGTGNPLPAAVTVAKLEYGRIGDGHFLAAACSHAVGYNESVSGPQEAKHSYIFRWNPYGSSRLEDGEVGLGAGFSTFQVLRQPGATDVVIFPEIQAVAFLAKAVAAGTDMQVSISRFDRSLFNVDTGSVEGRFDFVSTLSTPAAASLAGIDLRDVGSTLAVGSPEDTVNGIETVQMFIWDNSLADFVSMPSMVDNTCGATSAAGLRFFELAGEVYLIGTQQDFQSGVMQWNRVRQAFGWLLAITDADNLRLRGERVQDEEMDVHGQCFWFSAGLPLDWEFMRVGNAALIVGSGSFRGTLVFDFDFDTVAGLRGAAAIAVAGSPTGAGEAIWVAGEVDKAFVALNRTCESPVAGCLSLRDVFAEQPLRVSNVRDSREADRVQGLSAPRAMYKACAIKYCEDLICGTVCNASVIGGLDRSELECGPIPPAPSSVLGGDLSPPACQDVSFMVELDATDNPALFAASPRLTVDGELNFTLAEKEHGRADFRVSMHDSEGAMTLEQLMSIVVIPVNHAPTYELVPEVNGGRNQGVQSLVFARHVSPGALNEYQQNISFLMTNDLSPASHSLFLETPKLTVVSLGFNELGFEEWEGRVVWESPPGVTGSATISFVLVDNGPQVFFRGDVAESEPGTFELFVRENNAPPSFRFANRVLQIPEDAGMQVIPGFVVGIDPGAPGENDQMLEFVLVEVIPVDAVFDPDLLFTVFNISADGTLLFDTEVNFNGEYQVVVQLVDDGGTDFFGSNVSEALNFTLIVRANSTIPTWAVLQPYFSLLEQRDFSPEIYPAAVGNLSALPEDEVDQSLSFVVVENNATFLFVQGPSIDLNGTLTLTLNPHRSGVARLGIRLEKSDGERTAIQYISVSVQQVNDAPTFTLRTFVATLESAGPEVLLDVARELIAGPPDEDWQTLTFTVMYNTTVSGLFVHPPHMDPYGTLRFTAADDVHGEAVLWVSAADDGGTELGGVNFSTTQYCRVKIFPYPRVFKVTPRLSAVAGGALITVEGIFFGSEYSRGYRADAYGSLAVSVGGERCGHVAYVSDVAMTCVLPAGLGVAAVEVEVQDGVLTRRGVLEAGVLYSELYYGGVQALEDGRGAVATGPQGKEGGATLQIEVAASKGVECMLAWGDSLLVGGNFLSMGDKRVNYVAEWDGNDVRALGHGVDGHVHALVRWDSKVLVAGSFTRAMQSSGASVATGGLAAWNGTGWEHLGCSIGGTVAAVAVDERRIFAAGIFSQVCDVSSNNVAMWDAQLGWRALGEGVQGGGVEALLVHGTNVYVGGTFIQAGGRPAAKTARWDGRAWHSMGSLAGDVHALAAFGEYVFAGGEFLTAGGRQTNYVARFYSGEWEPVGGGVNGPVFALQSLNGCVWMGGAFTEARQRAEGAAIAAPNAVRWCVGAQQYEAVNATGGALQVGPIRAIEPALHTVYAPSCPTQGGCPANPASDMQQGMRGN